MPDSVAVYRCSVCDSTREQSAERDSVPDCGVLHTDTDLSRFPKGHWIRVTTEHYESHGPMRLVEVLEAGAGVLSNPTPRAERVPS